METHKAQELVERANAARKKGRPDESIERRFAEKCVEGFGGIQLRVFRIDSCALSREMPLELLENPAFDPFHPSFDMEQFRRENPLTEGPMK